MHLARVSSRARARVLAALLVAAPAASHAQTDAFSLSQTGNQAFEGLLGFDLWTRDRAIEITRIGAFDDGADGFNRTITVRLWNRGTGAGIGTDYVFTGTVGTLVGSYRFITLDAPITIAANTAWGIYAFGYGAEERNYNSGLAPFAGVPFDDGGLVTLGVSWFQPQGAGHATQDIWNRYGAANFTFQDPAAVTTTPEPATAVLVGGGFLVLLAAARRPRRA